MRGKLKTSFLEPEDMAIVEGTEVEIVDGWCGCDGYFYQCELPEGRQIVINSVNIEITDTVLILIGIKDVMKYRKMYYPHF